MILLETNRLRIREFTTADAPFIFELLNTPEWISNIGDRGIKTLQDAENYIKEKYLPLYDAVGIGAYVSELIETGEIIGTCGLYKRPDLDYPDIGFALLPKFVNKGYAYEAAKALMDFAKNELGLNTILGITISENKSSLKLLQKLGLRQIDIIRIKGDSEDLLLFSNAEKE